MQHCALAEEAGLRARRCRELEAAVAEAAAAAGAAKHAAASAASAAVPPAAAEQPAQLLPGMQAARHGEHVSGEAAGGASAHSGGLSGWVEVEADTGLAAESYGPGCEEAAAAVAALLDAASKPKADATPPLPVLVAASATPALSPLTGWDGDAALSGGSPVTDGEDRHTCKRTRRASGQRALRLEEGWSEGCGAPLWSPAQGSSPGSAGAFADGAGGHAEAGASGLVARGTGSGAGSHGHTVSGTADTSEGGSSSGGASGSPDSAGGGVAFAAFRGLLTSEAAVLRRTLQGFAPRIRARMARSRALLAAAERGESPALAAAAQLVAGEAGHAAQGPQLPRDGDAGKGLPGPETDEATPPEQRSQRASGEVAQQPDAGSSEAQGPPVVLYGLTERSPPPSPDPLTAQPVPFVPRAVRSPVWRPPPPTGTKLAARAEAAAVAEEVSGAADAGQPVKTGDVGALFGTPAGGQPVLGLRAMLLSFSTASATRAPFLHVLGKLLSVPWCRPAAGRDAAPPPQRRAAAAAHTPGDRDGAAQVGLCARVHWPAGPAGQLCPCARCCACQNAHDAFPVAARSARTARWTTSRRRHSDWPITSPPSSRATTQRSRTARRSAHWTDAR